MRNEKTESRVHPFVQPHKITDVLVIDDDVDSALLMALVFEHLGCHTKVSLDFKDAYKKMSSGKSDLIILDWVLDHQINANSVVKQCSKVLERFHPQGSNVRHKIITYSSLPAEEIGCISNPYFEHMDHWQKPLKREELLHRALGLLAKMKL